MSEELSIVFVSGEREVPMATLSRDEDGIDLRLCADSPELPFNRGRREKIVQRLVELPLRIARLRHRTMPQLFDEIAPGSEDHYALLQRGCGPFLVRRIND